MSPKASELPGTRDIVCPYCKGDLTVSANCMSMPCSHCNQHLNIQAILSSPSETKKKYSSKTRDIVCPYCKGNLTVPAKGVSIPCSHCNQHLDIQAILSPSKEKKKYSSETRDIVCPYCNGTLTVSTNCMSTPCIHCNQHINIKALLAPQKEKEKYSVEKRRLHCFQCEKEIFADEKAFAVICKYCSRRNDLSDYTVKSRLAQKLETHGTLYLKKTGKIEIPNVQVGDAIVQGVIKGNLKAVGTVEVLKRGEIHGKITCRKLIVNNGGIFDGSIEMLDARSNHS